MKHKIGFNRLDRSAAHRKALHRSMVTSLFKYERITTTKPKALEIRRSAEKIITRAKVDSVHNRRLVSRRLFDEGILAKLFNDIALRMKDRPGGYTRIVKLGARAGDAADMVILELVDYKLELPKAADEKKASKDESKKTAKPAAKKVAAPNKAEAEKKPAAKKKASPKAEKAEAK
ncbi:MAG: 50S ribosomal protein L17 [Treponema sp. GWB1_62_6]|nr:MAG: 50S ribosomal protein L17 [Treponema sp. GWA1_62_8]OHE69605.1 MAG: 50S ribosomal protein L17 [Treponema sp. GWC1_61_84]OHE71290.1 MAG: 50S ribosomal protein L17 [Treponema sp. GWB1_62_6]OHE71518.1 MAG: 50S ribosomal protein L17 [Treponema sp. RIFOXYC1_FULL_61_9]HCM25062.1 50S ribosomal protein L17 [Treponema sp.]